MTPPVTTAAPATVPFARDLAAHGDACPNNLLRHVDDDGFTLIDYGFWRPQPVAYDLSQLLVGEIQMRRLDADDLPRRAAELAASRV